MLRIGEVAKQFEISNRTLHYWEEMGILHSERAENGYRYYDSANELRIKQIVLLRALQLPIAEIERIFMSEDLAVAAEALAAHVERLRQNSADLSDLAVLAEELLWRVKEAPNLTQALVSIAGQREKSRLKTVLSERDITMSTKLSNVRIVRLPAMTVAAYRAEGPDSECWVGNCLAVIRPFVEQHRLNEWSGFRHFGRFSCNRSKEGNHYYEVLISIPEDLEVPAPLVKKQLDAGQYASIVTGISEIGECWTLLDQWVCASKEYAWDGSPWMEEILDYKPFLSGNEGRIQQDLLLPVKSTN